MVARSLDRAPKRSFGLSPKVESTADIGDALEVLAYWRDERAMAQAQCDGKVRLAKAEQAARLTVELEGSPLPLADAYAALEREVIRFATENREAVFTDGTKTRAMTHGTLSFRKRPKGIARRDGVSEDDVKARIEARAGLLSTITRWLTEIKIFDLALGTHFSASNRKSTWPRSSRPLSTAACRRRISARSVTKPAAATKPARWNPPNTRSAPSGRPPDRRLRAAREYGRRRSAGNRFTSQLRLHAGRARGEKM